MLSSYRIHPNTTNKRTKKVSNIKLDNNSHREHDLKRPQLTSNDLRTISNEPVKRRTIWKAVQTSKLTKVI